MKNGIPAIYWTFRMVWTFAHFFIVAAAAAALLAWALTDDHAARTFEPARDRVLEVQESVSNSVPWPWATGDDGGGDDRQQQGSNGNNSGSNSGITITVDANVNIHVAPRKNSKVVDVLDNGSSVYSDCKVEYGSRVRGSTRWDHIQGRGYISDAFVPTITDGLPDC